MFGTNSMATFSASRHVTVQESYQNRFVKDNKPYVLDHFKIPSLPDGNCSVNSFALALIALIKDGQAECLNFDFFDFASRMRDPKNVNKLINRLHNDEIYPELIAPLTEFIQFIQSGGLTRESFYAYIKDAKYRDQIAAIQLGLAPVLRDIGFQLHFNLLKSETHLEDQYLKEDHSIVDECVHAGSDILAPLAYHYFKINFLTVVERCRSDKTKYFDLIHSSANLAGAPTITLLNTPGHWDCLAPKSSLLVTQLQRQKQLAENNSIINTNDFTLFKLKAAADESAIRLKKLKEKYNFTEAQLAAVKLRPDEIYLLLNNISPLSSELTDTPEGRDAALARRLQNEELIDYLEKYHHTIVFKNR